MSQSHSTSRARYSAFPSPSPLFTASTFTFLASLRGQLLVCTVVLILGAVYLIVREPLAAYRRYRGEALSRVIGEELMSMNVEEKDDGKTSKEKERGREKRKDGKKRKGPLLRVPMGSGESSATGPSSIESSPAPLPRLATVPTPSRSRIKPVQSPAETPSPSQPEFSPSQSTEPKSTPNGHHLPPLIVPSLTPPFPWEVPLPNSPVAGPSRLHGLESEDASVNGDEVSDSAPGNKPALKTKGSSDGFSIMPEEGYLPTLQAPTGGKKKRKGKGGVLPVPTLPSAESSSVSQIAFPCRTASPGPGSSPIELPRTPSSRHARKASLSRPANADLEALLDERDRMIDSLRANIGQAKAEEGKARDDLRRAKATEERATRDVERMRRSSQKAVDESRRRENELQGKLNQMGQHHNATIQRINALESLFRDSGSPLPSPSPIPPQHLQQGSPLSPASPYGPQYVSPSGRAYMTHANHPGIFPSPMLHPYSYPHQTNSSSFLRLPSGVELNGSDGELPQDHLMPSPHPSGTYPGIGQGTMPLGSPAARAPSPGPSREGKPSEADLRRFSIESSVLKQKVKPKSGSESGDSSSNRAGNEPLLEANTDLEGLGFAAENGESKGNSAMAPQANSAEGSTSSSSHPASPSPQSLRHILITPATADLSNRNGTHTSDSPALPADPDGIKVVVDNERGDMYFRDERSRSPSPPSGKEEDGGEFTEPVFASLAHTPEQLREIARMREGAVRAQKGWKRLSEAGGIADIVPPLLTPSPSNGSLRRVS